jgi:hypothetical protein
MIYVCIIRLTILSRKSEIKAKMSLGPAELNDLNQKMHQRDSILTNSSNLTTEDRDATEEEINTLPLMVDKIPVAAWIVIVAGSCERFTYFGIIAPWRKPK